MDVKFLTLCQKLKVESVMIKYAINEQISVSDQTSFKIFPYVEGNWTLLANNIRHATEISK